MHEGTESFSQNTQKVGTKTRGGGGEEKYKKIPSEKKWLNAATKKSTKIGNPPPTKPKQKIFQQEKTQNIFVLISTKLAVTGFQFALYQQV